MKDKLWWIILIMIIVKLVIHIFGHKNYFLRSFDPAYFSDLYSKSQYVLGPASKGGIGDDGLYAFAGYYYFFQRGDVTDVNFEHPPIGKYLIGLSIFLFRNENIINIIYFLVLLYLIYKIGQRTLKSNLLAMISPLILSFDPLFSDHLLRSQLDLPFSLFFITAIYYFLFSLRKEKFLYLSFFFWGIAFSTRFFPLLIIIYFFLIVIVFIQKRSAISALIKASLFIPFVYLFSHLSFFFYHPSLIEFIRHKKWMISWFTGTPIIVGNIWRNILTSQYFDSTGKLVTNEHWSICLPIIMILGIVSIRKTFFSNKNIELCVLYGLILIYLLYVTFLTNGLHKFLMPIYPFLIILALHNLESLYCIIKAWRKNHKSLRRRS
jgi:predicted membrane-bound dolichyl-phosphate-mannose-protein mannosyltransferase